MKTMKVGEFKSRFADVLQQVKNGEEITIAYGKKNQKLAVIIPFSKYTKKNRQLDILKNVAGYKIEKDFEITDAEFLAL